MTESAGSQRSGGLGARAWLLIGLGITIAVVVVGAIWASADPDGLERVAEDLGFIEAGREPGFEILPDYTVPGLEGEISTLIAGLLGIAIVFGLVLLLGRVLARRRA